MEIIGITLLLGFVLMAFWLLVFIFLTIPRWIVLGLQDILKEKFGNEPDTVDQPEDSQA